jgi:hypothetical protein
VKKVSSVVLAVSIRLACWSATVAMATGLLLSVPVYCAAQPQPPQSAALEEAKRLEQQVIKLYNEGKYSTAISLAKRALAIREKALGKLENPLLRSGIALANINNRNRLPTGSDDGVLTALEVAGLNLRGTQLVVMSACDTGKGDIKVGEGVYGLRRALVISGSQSQVLSLWKVSDEATKELMVKYYSKFKAGKGRHEALREAQLEMLNSQDYQHPFFWAAFVPSGDWSPLNNR